MYLGHFLIVPRGQTCGKTVCYVKRWLFWKTPVFIGFIFHQHLPDLRNNIYDTVKQWKTT